MVASGTPLSTSKCELNNIAEVWALFQASDTAMGTTSGLGASQPSVASQSATREPTQNLKGAYSVVGVNPNGTKYRGEVTITADGDLYFFRWRISDGQIFRGKGRLSGRTLTVDWEQDYPVIYQVKDDGTLTGTWGNGRAREYLTPDR